MRPKPVKKNLQTYKPDSVLPFEEFCHLSGLACHHGALRCLPPLPRPPKRAIRARAAPVRWPKPGNKVYMAFQPARFIPLTCCHATACALTAHFHPYPDFMGRLFSVTLSVPRLVAGAPPVRWCGALCCPDFPPTRKMLPGKAAERSAGYLYRIVPFLL